jgi:hypothetical protein
MFAPPESMLKARAVWVLPEGHPIVQAWSWVVFAAMVAVSWGLTMGKVIQKLNEDTDMMSRALQPLRRTYILALCCYSSALVWLQILAMSCLLFVGAAIVFILYTFLPAVSRKAPMYETLCKFRNRAQMALSPSMHLASLRPCHMRAHGFILALVMLAPIVPTLFYIDKQDLRDQNKLRAKALRVLFMIPVIWGLGYGAYASVCTGRAVAALL